MNEHEDIGSRYFGDFICHKMNLEAVDPQNEGIAEAILRVHFRSIRSLPVIDRIATLHAYLHIHHLDLAKMNKVFEPLNKMLQVSG